MSIKYRRKSALAKGKNVNPASEVINLNKSREDIIDELADEDTDLLIIDSLGNVFNKMSKWGCMNV